MFKKEDWYGSIRQWPTSAIVSGVLGILAAWVAKMIGIPSLDQLEWPALTGLGYLLIFFVSSVCFLLLIGLARQTLPAGLERFWPWHSAHVPNSASGGRSYCSFEDEELSAALRGLVWWSAWSKWRQASWLASNDHEPVPEKVLFASAASMVSAALINGDLEAKGRPPAAVNYVPIGRDAWRLLLIDIQPDSRQLWRATIAPRSDVEPERVQKYLAYDSIVVDSHQFERLWPAEDSAYRNKTLKLLRDAAQAGAKADDINKIRDSI